MIKAEGAFAVDLGDSSFRIAYLDKHHNPKILVDDMGASNFASKVAFFPGGQVYVGPEAEMYGVPENTVVHPITIAGLGIRALQRLQDRYITRFFEERGQILIDAHRVYPTVDEVLTRIFIFCREKVSAALGRSINKIIIAVPDGADDAKRIQIKKSAQNADLEVQQLVNQNTAAILGYRFDQGREQRLAVIDVGASHASASILEVGQNRVEAVSTRHCSIGTNNFKDRLAKLINDSFRHETGTDLMRINDPTNNYDLLLEAGRLLIELSSHEQVVAAIGGVGPQSNRLVADISRSQFERAIASDLNELSDILSSTIKVDSVLLIGGGSNIPAIQLAVNHRFHKAPFTSPAIDPTHVIALGAARKSGILDGLINTQSVERTVHDLGTFYGGGNIMDVLIPRGTPLPCQQTKPYDNGTNDYIEKVYLWTGNESGQDQRESNPKMRVLKREHLRLKYEKIRITFGVDVNGIATFTVTEVGPRGNGQKHVLAGFSVQEERSR